MEGLNDIDGVTCLPSDGAMYAFPRVQLPPKALDEAALHEQTPDSLYALSLLEETGEYHTTLVSFNFDCLLILVPFLINYSPGICVVPASGFGQKEGRIGFRTTFLPPEDELNKAIIEFKRHHELFCDKYA